MKIKHIILILTLVLLVFNFSFCCAKTPYITDNIVKWGYSAPKKARLIDTIIIHSSYDALGPNPYSVAGVVKEYKMYGVSPHYLISRKGNIYRLVKDKYIAFQAGHMNNSSIGIELIHLKTESPDEVQYDSLVNLVNYLKSKHKIKYILGHSQVSTTGKTDPWNFDWDKFNQKLNAVQ